MGPARQRLRARVGHRRRGRPSRARHLPGLLPHPLGRQRPAADRRDPGRTNLLPAARRCSAAGHGRPAVEPSLPLLPRPGRVRPGGLRRARARYRLRRPAVARGLQRRLPAGRPGPDRGRRHALAARAGGPARPDAAAGEPAAGRLRVRGARRRRRARRPRPRRCCATLGFSHVGPHRCKPVQLWQHGEIRIVLNHGVGDEDPEVVAVAVESADPERSAARAEALCAPVLDRRRNPGEADLAAVAAPDGTSLFFCRTPSWLDDFLALEASADAEAVPISRIDHITLAQPFDAFDEAGLFYRSVLDLRPGDSSELAAPGRAAAQPGVRRRRRADRAQRAGAGRDAPGRAPARGLRVRGRARRGTRAARARRAVVADPRQLLRRPRGAVRPRLRRCVAGAGGALRP